MADNILLNLGSGGSTLRTDDDGTAHWPYSKMAFGADDTQTIVTASVGLPVEVLSGTITTVTTVGAVTAITNALPAGTNAIGKLAANSGVDIGDVDVTSVPAPLSTTGGGTEAAALRVTIANDSTGTLTVDNAGTFAVQSVATNAGTFAVQEDGAALTALQIMDDWDESDRCKSNVIVGQAGIAGGTGVDGATVPRMTLATDVALPAGTNLIGRAQVDAQAANGSDFYYSNDLDETEEQVKATAATLYGAVCVNLATSVRYLQIFNATAASVTVGSTTPDMQLPIPTQAATANGAGFVIPIPVCGVKFDTALTIAATTDSEGSGAPGANEVHIILFYK